MVDELDEWWQHDISVSRKTGSSGYTDTFDSPVVLKGFYDGGQRMVRSSTGDQVIAQATAFFPPTIDFIPTESLVAAPSNLGGRVGKVITCTKHEVGELELPTHWEVTLE